MLSEIFSQLEKQYRKRWEQEHRRKLEEWWPVSGNFVPKELEVVIGAILTQNTNWRNVEKALDNLVRSGLVDAQTIASCDRRKLERIVKPAGFFVHNI